MIKLLPGENTTMKLTPDEIPDDEYWNYPRWNLLHGKITHDEYRIYCTMKLPLTMDLPSMNLPHDENTRDEITRTMKLPTMKLPTMNLSHDEIAHDEFIARLNHPQ